MGLAPYGRPVFSELIFKHLLDLKDDGSFQMNMEFFNYCQGLTMTNRRFDDLFGGPARSPESMLEPRHMDLAASIQKVTEEIILRMGREVHRQTQQRHLVLAGGVALNCVANGRLLREGPFEDIWIQPAAGDAGGALGAALFVWHQLLDRPRQPAGRDAQKGSLLGPRYSNETIGDFLTEREVPHQRTASESELLETVAQLLAEGRIIGWFHGRMEFGPRALGGAEYYWRCAESRHSGRHEPQNQISREFPALRSVRFAERAAEYFELRGDQESPYMLIVAPVREKFYVPLSASDRKVMTESGDLRQRVNVVRSTLPAITHVDYSARLQTIDEERHGRFYRLIKEFDRLTGTPVIVNTSFNVRGEPIVCTPEEAYRCFLTTDMDALVLEDYVLRKADMKQSVSEAERGKHLAQFDLD